MLGALAASSLHNRGLGFFLFSEPALLMIDTLDHRTSCWPAAAARAWAAWTRGCSLSTVVPLALQHALMPAADARSAGFAHQRQPATWPPVRIMFGAPVLARYAATTTTQAPWPASLTVRSEHCETPFPADRAVRHAAVSARPGQPPGRGAGARKRADIAMASAPAKTTSHSQINVRTQPVFCLMRGRRLLESLVPSPTSGRRKIDAWTAQHKTVTVPFDHAGRRPRAFSTPTRWPNCRRWSARLKQR
jgi:hypothetical protein